MGICIDTGDLKQSVRYGNCEEIGFDTKKRWNKIICTYKLFQGKQMWKVKTGEREIFWCTLLVFNQDDCQ